MAAVQNRQHSNILAITPDARPCDALLPIATTATSSSSSSINNNEAALAQYLQYRSAPSLYPSYDRLRFVRLPSNYLPSHLLRQNQNHNSNNDDNDSYSSLQYWPAIIYENYAELVRDLGKAASAKTKAKFSVRHRKFGSNAVVVARLLMWDDSLVGAPTCSSEGLPPAKSTTGNSSSSEGGGGGDDSKKSSSNTCLFPEPTIHIVQLDSSLSQLESSNSSSRLVSFYDAQFDLEECCTELLRRYSPSSTTTNNNKKSGGGEEEERRRVYNYALQFQKAVDMALNCLALDVGGDVLHDRVMKGEESTATTTPGGGGGDVASNTATTTAAAVKNKEGAAKKKKRQVVEKRVQNLEIAIPPTTNANATTTTNAITTKPKAVGPNETMKQPQDVLSRKESTTRTESKRGGGGGGTKSKRSEVSQPIPKKFQSTSKTATTTATASTSTTTKDVTTTTTTMNQTNNPIPPWKDVWKIMRSNGWTWKGSTGLSTGYRYIKPNCKIKNGIEHIDYFNSEQDVQSFARNVYGWGIREHTLQSLSEVIQDHAKYAGEYVPPLMTSIGPREPWRDVWDKMRLRGGWTWKTGSGLMMDYYYIKPNCTIKGGVKGQDYFETVEEVQLFAKRNYGWVGEEEGEENGGGGEQHRPALMDLNENTLPEKKRRRTEKVSMDNKPAVKKVKSLKSKMEEVKPINEEEEEEEVMEEEGEEEEEFGEEMASRGENDDANDDDDTSRFSEARSTYSQSGFQSKKLFINECADEYVPSLEGEQIYPDDPWNIVWKTMRKTGWTWKAGSGLMMDYYYIKPGCNVKDGEEGKDYFVSEEDVQRFAERNYGWNRGVVISSDHVDSRGKGRKRSLSTSSSDGSHFSEANDDCAADEIKKKKKKTTKRIQMSPNQEQNDHASSAPLRLDPYTWKTLWPALQKDGWKVVKAGKYNRLHDWYYVRPDCDPGDGSSELHIDYFLSEEDVCGFARQTNYFDGYEESEPVYEESAEQAQKTEQAPKRVKSSSKHPSTPEGCKTQPQDPAKPLLSSAESCSSQFSSSSNDYYDWNNLWPVLQTGGWRVIKASNPLHDWYYVRPNRDPKDPTTKLGRHYFTCPDEVIDFVKRLDEKDGKQSRKSDIGGMLKAFEEEATVYSGSQL